MSFVRRSHELAEVWGIGIETSLIRAFVFNGLKAPKTPRGKNDTFGNISAVSRSLRVERAARIPSTFCASIDPSNRIAPISWSQIVYNLKLGLDAFLFMALNVVL